MRILVIPEDFRNDQYILKPLFSRLFESFGKHRARIEICRDPLLGGVSEAIKSRRIQEIVSQHRISLFFASTAMAIRGDDRD